MNQHDARMILVALTGYLVLYLICGIYCHIHRDKDFKKKWQNNEIDPENAPIEGFSDGFELSIVILMITGTVGILGYGLYIIIKSANLF